MGLDGYDWAAATEVPSKAAIARSSAIPVLRVIEFIWLSLRISGAGGRRIVGTGDFTVNAGPVAATDNTPDLRDARFLRNVNQPPKPTDRHDLPANCRARNHLF